MSEKVTIIFLTDKSRKWQTEKAKLMMQSFIKKEDITRYMETKEDVYIETKTHRIRIIGMTQSPRGYRANFIIDLSGFIDAQETANIKSTYNWRLQGEGESFKHHIPVEHLEKQLKENGWNV